MKLPCGMLVEELVAYYEGDPLSLDRTEARAHVRTCAECQRWLSDFQEVDQLLHERFPLITDRTQQQQLKERLLEEVRNGNCP